MLLLHSPAHTGQERVMTVSGSLRDIKSHKIASRVLEFTEVYVKYILYILTIQFDLYENPLAIQHLSN